MKKNDELIIIEETFMDSNDTVWKSITEIDKMHKCFFEEFPAFVPECTPKNRHFVE